MRRRLATVTLVAVLLLVPMTGAVSAQPLQSANVGSACSIADFNGSECIDAIVQSANPISVFNQIIVVLNGITSTIDGYLGYVEGILFGDRTFPFEVSSVPGGQLLLNLPYPSIEYQQISFAGQTLTIPNVDWDGGTVGEQFTRNGEWVIGISLQDFLPSRVIGIFENFTDQIGNLTDAVTGVTGWLEGFVQDLSRLLNLPQRIFGNLLGSITQTFVEAQQAVTDAISGFLTDPIESFVDQLRSPFEELEERIQDLTQ